MDPYVLTLSQRLTAARMERGWSLDDLSRRTERSPLPVERLKAIEAGEPCELEELERVLDALNPTPRARSSLLGRWLPDAPDAARGERLKAWRSGVRLGRGPSSSVGLDLDALSTRTASRVGLTTVRKIEQGQSVPSPRLMRRIADALSLSGDLRSALMAWSNLGTCDVQHVVTTVEQLQGAMDGIDASDTPVRGEPSPNDANSWRQEVRLRRLPADSPLPAVLPLERSKDLRERVRAMLWGVAIGDALAWPHTEIPVHRRAIPIEGYGPGGGHNSVDGHLCWLTLEHLRQATEFAPDALMQVLTSKRVSRLGRSQARAFASYLTSQDWRTCGVRSASIGGVVRVMPLVLPHLLAPADPQRLWEDVTAATILTHDDDATVAVSAALASIAIEAFRRPAGQPTPQGWWIERFLEVVTCFPRRQLTPSQDSELRWEGASPGASAPERLSLVELVSDLVTRLDQGWELERVAARYGSGYYLVEAVPCLLTILERHGSEPTQAILAAVNHLRASDSLASIIGALMGVRHGWSAFPEAWLDGHHGYGAGRELTSLIEVVTERYTAPRDPVTP